MIGFTVRSMSGREPLREVEIDHIIESVQLKVAQPVRWSRDGRWWKSSVAVVGHGILAELTMTLSVSQDLPGRYSYQLRQNGGPILRRLDVRGPHRNRRATGNEERWAWRTHKHRHRDAFGDQFAYTPTDIPPTTSPAQYPEPGEHQAVFVAFCAECGLDEAGMWADPPISGNGIG